VIGWPDPRHGTTLFIVPSVYSLMRKKPPVDFDLNWKRKSEKIQLPICLRETTDTEKFSYTNPMQRPLTTEPKSDLLAEIEDLKRQTARAA